MNDAITRTTEVWQASIGREFAAELLADADVLGLSGRTNIVKAALALLHRNAAKERMAQSVDEFYGDALPPLPIGVMLAEDDPAGGPRMVDDASGTRGHT